MKQITTVLFLLLFACTKEPQPKTTAEKIIGEWRSDNPPHWIYTFCADGTGLMTVSIGDTDVTQFQVFYNVKDDTVRIFKYEPEPAESITWLVRWKYSGDSVAQIRQAGVFKPFLIRKM